MASAFFSVATVNNSACYTEGISRDYSANVLEIFFDFFDLRVLQLTENMQLKALKEDTNAELA